MIAFLDSSALLRIVLDEPGKFPDHRKIRRAVASEILPVECHRTLDRLRLRGELSESELSIRLAELHLALRRIDFIAIGPRVLDRAAAPFPTSLGTLDAIHLSSALLWREVEKAEALFVTHDAELARAATASGFKVAGV